MSKQQLLYQIHKVLSLVELKAYLAMQFWWMVLSSYGHEKFPDKSIEHSKLFEERRFLTIQILRKSVKLSRNVVYRCDPEEFVEGETFVRFTKLLQGYVEHEVDMKDQSTCDKKCAGYEISRKSTECIGAVHDCQDLDANANICPAEVGGTNFFKKNRLNEIDKFDLE